MNTKELFSNLRTSDEREEFDNFLKKIKFSYTIPSVHITGTNGKGSTASYLANILTMAGYKVGLFNSPYFMSPCEMIKINNRDISEEQFLSIYNEYKKDIQKADLSEFEIETLIAFTYFQREKCDIAVIECGMGGELDATNIFTPVLSIITSVSLEHTAFLGRSLSEIAIQKAGIIKEEVPVLLYQNVNEDVLKVFSETAKSNNTKLYQVEMYHFEHLEDDGYHFMYSGINELVIPTKSLYSITDACLAMEALKFISESFPVNEKAVRDGLKMTRLPGRMSEVNHNPLIIVDGAHNPEAVSTLVKDIGKLKINGEIHVVFASFTDKNITNELPDLGLISNDLTLTHFNHPRCREEEDYFLYLEDYKYNADHQTVIQQLMKDYPDDTILVTGSLAFAMLVYDEFLKGIYK